MKKQIKKQIIGILIVFKVVMPVQGMKRAASDSVNAPATLVKLPPELPSDVWKYLFTFLSLSRLKVIAQVSRAFNGYINSYIAPDPTFMSKTDKKKELLTGFAKGQWDRVRLILSTLSDRICSKERLGNENLWEECAYMTLCRKVNALRWMLNNQDQIKKHGLLKIQNAYDRANNFKTSRYDSHDDTIVKEVSRLEEATSLIDVLFNVSSEKDMEEALAIRKKELEQASPEKSSQRFRDQIGGCFVFAVMGNHANFVSDLMKMKTVRSCLAKDRTGHYLDVLANAQRFSGPAINVSLMRWLFESQFENINKFEVYLCDVFKYIQQNKQKHLQALLDIPQAAADIKQCQAFLFYLALINDSKKCIQILVDRGMCPDEKIAQEYVAGTLYTNQECMAAVFRDIYALSKSKPDRPASRILNIFEEFTMAPACQEFIYKYLSYRLNIEKEYCESDEKCMMLLYHILIAKPSEAHRITNVLFSSDKQCFKALCKWPVQLQVRTDYNFTHVDALMVFARLITVLNQIVYWALALGKYEYLSSIVEENIRFQPSIVAAVIDDWFQDIALANTDRQYDDVCRLISYNVVESSTNMVEEYDILRAALRNTPVHIKNRLKYCCFFNEIFWTNMFFANPVISVFPESDVKILWDDFQGPLKENLKQAIEHADVTTVQNILASGILSKDSAEQALSLAHQTNNTLIQHSKQCATNEQRQLMYIKLTAVNNIFIDLQSYILSFAQ